MITREQYLAFAKKNEVPMELLYIYYNTFNQRKDLTFSLESFSDIFSQFLATFALNLESVRAYYDRFYNITTVYDKHGNFVTIY